MRRSIFCLLFVVLLLACSDQAAENAAIETVKSSASASPGTSTIDYMTLIAQTSSAIGNDVKPLGWMATKGEKAASYDVVFIMKENDHEVRFEWSVMDGKVIPKNKIARDISPENQQSNKS